MSSQSRLRVHSQRTLDAMLTHCSSQNVAPRGARAACAHAIHVTTSSPCSSCTAQRSRASTSSPRARARPRALRADPPRRQRARRCARSPAPAHVRREQPAVGHARPCAPGGSECAPVGERPRC
eukprot:372677-Prymnesium_polylepis.1